MPLDVQQMQRDTTHDTAAQEAQTTGAPMTPTTPTTPSTAPVGRPPIAPPAAIGQGWNWFLRILGIVLAIGGGITLWYAMLATDVAGHEGIPPADWLVVLALIGFAAWAAVAAGLMRTWWALLIVPVAFLAGMAVTRGSVIFGPPLLLSSTVPAIIGAVIGTPLGRWVERRIRR